MLVDDKVYGNFEVNEPVLLELLETKPLIRLKKIHQAGASYLVIKSRAKTTRLDHSLGVLFLLKKFGASLEEQIAGLLHDIPHTAFSHVIDFVFPTDEHNHEYHEKFFEKMIFDSEIPKILKKYGFSPSRILDKNNFSLLEREMPDLCADRIDYFLRDRVDCLGKTKEIKEYVDSFCIFDQEIIFKDSRIALSYARDYLDQDTICWSNPYEIALYKVLAEAIKEAMKEGLLVEADLFKTDEEVIKMLRKSRNKKIKKLLSFLKPGTKVIRTEKNYDFFLRNKIRYIDPKVLVDGKLIKVSTIYPGFKKEIQRHNEKIRKGFYVKLRY